MDRMIQAVDLFCGAGGTSSGLYHACNHMGVGLNLVAINHWPRAIETHQANHPDARHICATLESIDPRVAVPSGHLDIMVASPECTHHSVARGGKPVNDQLRASAWHLLRWIELLKIDNILIENVREFRDWGPTDTHSKPIKKRKGETYQAFLSVLRSMNYTVEDRILNAADYGDPTSRHRLFIIARRGHKKITWPKAAFAENVDPNLFGDELRPYRTAREIIDWALPGESIFKRKKALAPATMNRIAAGLRKYGGKNAEPFLVMMYGSSDARSLDRPMPTITAGGNHIGLAEPFLVHITHKGGDRAHSIDSPVPTITCAHRGEMALIEPFVLGQQSCAAPRSVDKPLPTIATAGAIALVEPYLIRYHGNHQGKDDGEKRTHGLDQPIPTLDTSNRYALIEPFITIMKGQSKTRDIDSPVPTITTNPHLYLCEPFITKYYGTANGQSIDKPLDTITTKDRFGLVEPVADGETVYDIRFRMLQPHELAAAMSFDPEYQFSGNKTDRIKQIGNAVPVRTAAALCGSLLAAKN
jgi:DNA (cytosine-5)-methyltransferase 1